MSDEILVKGKDGKWYVLKGGELLPYEQKTEDRKQKTPVPEQSSVRGTAEIIQPVSPPSSVLRPPVPPIPPKSPTSFSHEGHPLRVELDELVTQVIENVKLKMQNVKWLDDPVLQKRFRTIVSARLRDVRDSAETKAMLLRDQKIGGMGLSSLEHGNMVTLVDEVVTVIEKAFAEFQNKWQAVEKKRIEEWKAKQKQEQEKRTEQKIKEEQEELKKRYEKMTGLNVDRLASEVRAKDAVVHPSEADTARRSAALSRPVVGIPARLASATLLSQTPAAKQSPLAVQFQKMVVKESRPAPLTPRPSTPPPPVTRPTAKITDVRPAPKLVGPIEELSSITLKDFRRIAATPQAGVDKILSKVDFLSKESLIRRTEGIKAWQSSPLFKIYSKISATALTGRCSPQSVLERFTAEGQSVLTLEEFYAIMDLNHRLRY